MLQDERLTSPRPTSSFASAERDWRRRKAQVDAVAAAIILQDYLDSRPRPVAAESRAISSEALCRLRPDTRRVGGAAAVWLYLRRQPTIQGLRDRGAVSSTSRRAPGPARSAAASSKPGSSEISPASGSPCGSRVRGGACRQGSIGSIGPSRLARSSTRSPAATSTCCRSRSAKD